MDKKLKNRILIAGGVILGLVLLNKYLNSKKGSNFNVCDLPGGCGSGGSGATGNGLDYYTLADNLFSYMDGYGTNNKSIYAILNSLSNQNDWDMLQKAYGRRTISSGLGNVFVDDFTGDLKSSLEDELSKSEYTKAKKALTDKGIKF